ncbi:unnamed protein product, partial [Chrysoparadoxa australica]
LAAGSLLLVTSCASRRIIITFLSLWLLSGGGDLTMMTSPHARYLLALLLPVIRLNDERKPFQISARLHPAPRSPPVPATHPDSTEASNPINPFSVMVLALKIVKRALLLLGIVSSLVLDRVAAFAPATASPLASASIQCRSHWSDGYGEAPTDANLVARLDQTSEGLGRGRPSREDYAIMYKKGLEMMWKYKDSEDREGNAGSRASCDCPTCKGKGMQPCRFCRGTGMLSANGAASGMPVTALTSAEPMPCLVCR